MPCCLPPVHICTEKRPTWCLCFGLRRGTFTWSQDIVWRRCGYASTQNQSVRRATADHCHPVVRPCTPGGKGGDNQTSKVVFLSSIGLGVCVSLVFMFWRHIHTLECRQKPWKQIGCWICLLVLKLRWDISTGTLIESTLDIIAYAGLPNMLVYDLALFNLSATLYANRSVAARDKYTCSKPACGVQILQIVVKLHQ